MKEINDSTDLELAEYPRAEDLTQITITPEQHHENQKHNLLKDLFGDMAKTATVGNNTLKAPFQMTDTRGNITTDPRFVGEVSEILNSLGYITTTVEKDDAQGTWTLLTIEWARPEVTSD